MARGCTAAEKTLPTTTALPSSQALGHKSRLLNSRTHSIAYNCYCMRSEVGNARISPPGKAVTASVTDQALKATKIGHPCAARGPHWESQATLQRCQEQSLTTWCREARQPSRHVTHWEGTTSGQPCTCCQLQAGTGIDNSAGAGQAMRLQSYSCLRPVAAAVAATTVGRSWCSPIALDASRSCRKYKATADGSQGMYNVALAHTEQQDMVSCTLERQLQACLLTPTVRGIAVALLGGRFS